MIRKLLKTSAAVTVAALMVGAGQAAAAVPGLTATVIVKEASQVGTCTAGLATYSITADITVDNTSGLPMTVLAADYAANAFNSTNTPIGTLVASATSVGGLTALPLDVASGTTTFTDATFTVTGVPCSAIPAENTDRAELCLTLTVVGGTTDPACTNFIAGGTAIPAGTIGLIAFAVLLGLALPVAGVFWRRRQRAGVAIAGP